ncbi:copper amine oxidase [Aspergillus flavus AF70]|nr:copper amine oxidase [Aspergillus flavus AF70]
MECTKEDRISSLARDVVQSRYGGLTSEMLLAKPGSWHWRRSEFCKSPFWVIKYNDRQLFPAGNYANQSLGGAGIKSCIERAMIWFGTRILWFGTLLAPPTIHV